jgi:hypothetical protein
MIVTPVAAAASTISPPSDDRGQERGYQADDEGHHDEHDDSDGIDQTQSPKNCRP